MDLSNKNIIHVKKDEIEYLQFKRLLEFENLEHCYTLSANNVDFVRENNKNLDSSYEKICKALNIERKNIVRPMQSHTDCIKNVEEKLSKIRKLGYLCLVLASYHYFLTPKIPMFWEWSALIIALFYFIVRYTKTLKKLKSNNLTFIKT